MTTNPEDDFDECDDLDEWDEWEEKCGLLPASLGGGCTMAGCDFECPFRDHPEWLTGDGDDD